MNNLKLVIKGAWYFNGQNLLVPRFTGQFVIVDCDRYITIKDLVDQYDLPFIEEAISSSITYNGVLYYPAEYSTFNITDWELLSDLSELSFEETEYNF